MSTDTLIGLPRSTFVKAAGLVLTARCIDRDFADTENGYDNGTPNILADSASTDPEHVWGDEGPLNE